MCHGANVGVRGQLARVGSFLPTCESGGWHSGLVASTVPAYLSHGPPDIRSNDKAGTILK